MKTTRLMGTLLLIFGALAMFISTQMFGDIGIAAAIGSITAIMAGIGLRAVGSEHNG